jgi:hypothetical protein
VCGCVTVHLQDEVASSNEILYQPTLLACGTSAVDSDSRPDIFLIRTYRSVHFECINLQAHHGGGVCHRESGTDFG